MHNVLRRLLCSVGAAGAAMSPCAHAATVIDFETVTPGIYFDAEPIVTVDGYTLAPAYGFGQVDTAAGVSTPPSGNATQFYFQPNEGLLVIQRDDGGLFTLNSFSAAFVPQTPAQNQTTVILAFGTYADNSYDLATFAFGADTGAGHPFQSHVAPEFLSNLKRLEFLACPIDGVVVCSTSPLNNAQFAIDDIRLTAAVPEPAAMALMVLGLLGLGLRLRTGRGAG